MIDLIFVLDYPKETGIRGGDIVYIINCKLYCACTPYCSANVILDFSSPHSASFLPVNSAIANFFTAQVFWVTHCASSPTKVQDSRIGNLYKVAKFFDSCSYGLTHSLTYLLSLTIYIQAIFCQQPHSFGSPLFSQPSRTT